MEIIFSRTTEDQTIPLSIKSSVHLIEGIIYRVEATVHVSWEVILNALMTQVSLYPGQQCSGTK
ncbi:hypothetical protein MKW98_025181, partial [Papaver atlanticum]